MGASNGRTARQRQTRQTITLDKRRRYPYIFYQKDGIYTALSFFKQDFGLIAVDCPSVFLSEISESSSFGVFFVEVVDFFDLLQNGVGVHIANQLVNHIVDSRRFVQSIRYRYQRTVMKHLVPIHTYSVDTFVNAP